MPLSQVLVNSILLVVFPLRILFDAPIAAITQLVSFFLSSALLQSNTISFSHCFSNPGISAMICG
jgi:hypothetical protein